MKKLITGIAMVAVAGIATAAPIDFSSDFSGGADWGWTSTSGATGTGAMTVNPNSDSATSGYAQKAITPDGATDITLSYSFDLDISSLIQSAGTGSQMSLFTIGAGGNQGPIVGAYDGMRTEVYLVTGASQGIWGFGVGSGKDWSGGTWNEIGARSALTEAQEGSLHFAGTLILTDTTVNNSLTVTASDGYSQTGSSSTSDALLGANTIDSYSLGALQAWAKENMSGDIVFDNFEISAIPEPATLGLIGSFGVAVLFIRRRLMM